MNNDPDFRRPAKILRAARALEKDLGLCIRPSRKKSQLESWNSETRCTGERMTSGVVVKARGRLEDDTTAREWHGGRGMGLRVDMEGWCKTDDDFSVSRAQWKIYSALECLHMQCVAWKRLWVCVRLKKLIYVEDTCLWGCSSRNSPGCTLKVCPVGHFVSRVPRQLPVTVTQSQVR